MPTLSALEEIHDLELAVAYARKTLEHLDPVPQSVLEEEVDDYFGLG